LGIVSVHGLAEARERIGDKWCRGVDGALVAVGVGLRSPAKSDFNDLVATSRVLPEPLWNQWVALADGGPDLCLDALWVEAGLAGEVTESATTRGESSTRQQPLGRSGCRPWDCSSATRHPFAFAGTARNC
jgi:hypothetical protein